jgi:hypothetical protein
MKHFILIAGIFVLMNSAALRAQVTIGVMAEPQADAVLELRTQNNNKGFLPPRISLTDPKLPEPLSAHVQGMVVYNTNTANSLLIEGLYINNGTQWIALRQAPSVMQNWFYMPSFPLEVSEEKTYTVDLWEKYKNSFSPAASDPQLISTGGSPELQPLPADGSHLYYYITGYDKSVFKNVKLTSDGKLTYTIEDLNMVSDATYMNIILLMK